MKKVLVTGGSGFIGRHLISHFIACGYELTNVDIAPPTDPAQHPFWRKASILDARELAGVLRDVQPAYVVHLAAYASMEARSLEEFRVNTEGTANLLAAIKSISSVERLVITSSQHVRKPGSGLPSNDTDYVPYMYYGESKMITERLTRGDGLPCAWTIIRPTAVWGAYQLPLADGAWKLINRRLFIHPSCDPVIRSYGYVKNVVWQIERLLQAPVAAINRATFYVGDENMRQYDWVNGFARALTGRDVRTMPLLFIRLLALIGDGFKAAGLSFPIYHSRLQNLITPNPIPIENTLQLLGKPPCSLNDGINETVDWLKAYYGGKH